MLHSKSSQFSLSPEGKILWQEKLNNPLPGQEVAQLVKGDHVMMPKIDLLDNALTQKEEKNELLGHLNGWLKTYMKDTIEPLVLLEVPQGAAVKEDAVSKIAQRIYDGLGIVPREELEELISDLTPETRADLRAKKIRLGPILAFIPALNKPAAVRLRALLWSLFNDGALPAKVPADGIVSARIDDEKPNEDFYRSIGYPFYGGRVIRIDMLDRVISCVYDHADKGKFQARHEMAEWLGCPIDDLYKILEAMGHTKVYDPADEKVEEKVAEENKTEEKPVEATAESAEGAVEEKKQADTRPELATFRLKRGKAFEKKGGDAKGGKKPFKKADKVKSFKKKDHKSKKPRDGGPRVISVEAKKQEDSPFAILLQLKK